MTLLTNMVQASDFALPATMLAVLPKDPHDQLEIAMKITSMAVSSRVSALEAEAYSLRQKLADRDTTISTLQGQVNELQHELELASVQLSNAIEDQERLAAEKVALEASVKKLTRDVAKLETFKKALMSSLQEEEESPAPVIAQDKRSNEATEKKSKEATRLASPPVVVTSESESSPSPAPTAEPEQDHEIKSTSRQVFHLTPSNPAQNLNPGLSPIKSSRRHSASSSPTRSRSMAISPTKKKTLKGSSAATSPIKTRSMSISSTADPSKGSNKWHSVSDGRLSFSSSTASSKHTTAPNSPPHSARAARVDGKEFFRQARNRLSYEQFSAFLANIKELNAHKQTREETLQKANQIFGPENGDLYVAFNTLLSRHLPGEN
ncbi:hypothetical protein KP509_31G043000 [Ceratopteris richardii]|nr:hypothetical protein KP509_31G043000 [Ceratopteris richardii]